MSLWRRAARKFKTTRAALEDPQDPDATLDASFERALHRLGTLRSALAGMVAARRRVEGAEEKLRQAIEELEGQARAAVAGGREDGAREALARRAELARDLRYIESRRKEMAEERATAQASRRLERWITRFRGRVETMRAAHARAEARMQVEGLDAARRPRAGSRDVSGAERAVKSEAEPPAD